VLQFKQRPHQQAGHLEQAEGDSHCTCRSTGEHRVQDWLVCIAVLYRNSFATACQLTRACEQQVLPLLLLPWAMAWLAF
jgi:hypothetical protein